tara:strand:+ start:625 stop:1194 length:570 start_codon:yes stop_codon:yes gene_type:complete
MWALVESGSVSKIYTRPKQLTLGDVNYPSNIFTMWSASELEAIGIYEVVIDNTNYKDPNYYNNTNQSFTFADNKVTASYGTATARLLEDTTVDGKVVKGIRPAKLVQVNNEAYGLLQSNDWMVVKATETSGTVASDWTTYRTNVRSTAQSMKTKINAVSDVDALAALYVYNDDDPPTRPLGEFPTPPTS